MSLSSTLAKVSAKVIKQFGTTVTFTHKVQASFDPGTGTQVNNDTVYTANAVKAAYEKEEIDGTTILASDIKLILERTATMPETGDTCVIGTKTYRVMPVRPIDPADYVIINEVQLRL